MSEVQNHKLSLLVDTFVIEMDRAREEIRQTALATGSNGSKVVALSTGAFERYVAAKRGASGLVALDESRQREGMGINIGV